MNKKFFYISILLLLVGVLIVLSVFLAKETYEIKINEIIDSEWVEYDYFMQEGRNEKGEKITMITIYWYKIGDEGITIYVTDGKKWEEIK